VFYGLLIKELIHPKKKKKKKTYDVSFKKTFTLRATLMWT
jgi:ribosomal protein L31